MSIIFTFRLFDTKKYSEIIPVLKKINGKTFDVNEEFVCLIEETQAIAAGLDFVKYNNEFSIIEDWPKLLKKAIPVNQEKTVRTFNEDTKKELIGIIIALLCMPKFQFYYTSGTSTVSEYCFNLGRWDGKLLATLQRHTDWFNQIFEWDYPYKRPEYGYGNAMALLTPDQVKGSEKALDSAAVICENSEKLLHHYTRLYNLVKQSILNPAYTIAICEE